MSELCIDRLEYYMKIAHDVAERSTCLRRKVGAIAVKDDMIIATGYNGAPRNISHCSDNGCIRKLNNIPSGKNHELCRAVHAEQNLIIQCALTGTSIKGAMIICTTYPCSICLKMLINCNIHSLVIDEDYSDKLSKELLSESALLIRKL